MEISADQARWLLSYYRDRSMRLQFGGRVLGEEATCTAFVTAIDPELKLATVELLDEAAGRSWSRTVPLREASVFLYLLGRDPFEEWMSRRWHSILLLQYPDATSLFFAEPVV
jgi:hypothetical protein